MGKVVGILCTDKRWLDRLRRCCADEGLVYTLFRILEMILSKAGLLPKARKQAMLLALLQDDKTRLEMSMGDLQSALADKEARIKAMEWRPVASEWSTNASEASWTVLTLRTRGLRMS